MNAPLIKDAVSRENLIYLLLFLFPTIGAFTRHWFSTLYILITLTAIYTLIRRGKSALSPLHRQEKIVLAGMAVFFVAYLLPAATHSFDVNALEVEIRYLLFIPVYLMVRELESSQQWFLVGVVLGAICIFVYGMYELYILRSAEDRYFISGAYMHHYYGSIAVVTAFLALMSQHSLPRRLRWLCVIAFVLALISAILSGSRGSYVTALLAAVMWAALRLNTRVFILFVVALGLLGISLYSSSSTVNYQIGRAVDDVIYYFTLDDFSAIPHEKRSASSRLELWELSVRLIRDHPWLGIGRGNFKDHARRLMTEAQREDIMLDHSHPHNAFLQVLISKGIVGAGAFCLMFFYPFYVFLKDYRASPATALPGVMLMVTFLAYGLTEIPFIKNNGTAVYLLFLAVLFSTHVRQMSASSYREARARPE